MMKRTLALLLAAMLLLSALSACGGDAAPATDAPAADTPATDAPAADVPETAAPEDGEETADVVRGSVENGVYTSDFAQLSISMPTGWTAADDEMIASAVGVGMDNLQNISEEEKAIAVSGTIYDAILLSPDQSENIMVMLEDLKTTAGTTLVTAETYAGILHDGLADMTGMDYVVEDPEAVTLAGEDYMRMNASVSANGATVYQTYLFRWVSDYMLTITITAQSAEDCEALTACVQPLAA